MGDNLVPLHQHLPPAKGEKCYPCVRYGMSPISRAAHKKLAHRTFAIPVHENWASKCRFTSAEPLRFPLKTVRSTGLADDLAMPHAMLGSMTDHLQGAGMSDQQSHFEHKKVSFGRWRELRRMGWRWRCGMIESAPSALRG
jgi:hypothetical protein